VLSGDIAPDVVVVLAPEELASDAKRNENARIREKKLFDSAPAAMKQVGKGGWRGVGMKREGWWLCMGGLSFCARPLLGLLIGAVSGQAVSLPFVSLPSCPSSLFSLPPQT
jgi:hypothetical protein